MTAGRTVSLKSWMLMTAALVPLATAMGLPIMAAAHADATVVEPAAAKREFRIPPQSLAAALNEFGRQSGRDILFSTEVAAAKRTAGVGGSYAPEEALRLLLLGTGLRFRATNERTFLIERQSSDASSVTPASGPGDSQQANSANANDPNGQNSENVEKVTVTGSRVRGAKQAAPVVTITQDDMKRQGANDLGQAIRALPQNFNGGQNPGVSFGSGGDFTNQNVTGSSSVNLRGLGADATLTLLNGTRLPYDGFTQATDVTAIPVAAIDRVEILLDGASAIYGSDAVGGVVNILLKRDFEGAEVLARYGKATDGGYEQRQFSAVAGTTWNSGGFIITSDFSASRDIKAGQRDYLAYLPPQLAVYPPATQKGALFSGHQRVSDIAELTLDAFYTERAGEEFANLASVFGVDIKTQRDSTIWGIAPALRVDLAADWSLRVHGAAVANQGESDQRVFLPDGTPISQIVTCYCNTAEAAGVEAEGPLFSLPGGDLRLAVGGGLRKNRFESIDRVADQTRLRAKDSSRYIYGEVNVPLISSEQGIPLIERLSLNGAVRYEAYDSFGETTTPKVGAIWSLTSDIDLKASWGKSFKVPSLSQQFSSTDLFLTSANDVGGVGFPVGSGVLILAGGNPGLTPEKAETLTAGFIVRPAFLEGFRLEVNRFDVDYTDRIVTPISFLSSALADPAYLQFVTFSPGTTQQNAAFGLAGLPVGTFLIPPDPSLLPYNPAQIVAIVDARDVNAASQRIEGVDLLASYSTELIGGDFTASANATWLNRTQKFTSLAPEQAVSGFVFYPAEFRGRIGATWARDGLVLAAFVNRTGGVTDTTVTPNLKGSSMTTVDVTAEYAVEPDLWGHRVIFNLAVTNLFDQAPPLLGQPPFPGTVNYDSTNYSAVGRVVSATVSVQF